MDGQKGSAEVVLDSACVSDRVKKQPHATIA